MIDINSSMWNRKEQDFEKYNSIIMSPRKWIENNLPDIVQLIEIVRKQYVDDFSIKFGNMIIDHKYYSTYKLSDRSISNDERIYIMQIIGLLKIQVILTKFNSSNLCFGIYEKQ